MSPDLSDSGSSTQIQLFIPYRVSFPWHEWRHHLSSSLPILWHVWSGWTDIRRIPLHRRMRILWRWSIMRPPTLPVPVEGIAVRWWLSRLLGGERWRWDTEFVLERAVGSALHENLSCLRQPLRELLFPEALSGFLRDELARPDEGHYYVPPVATYHLRLGSLPPGTPGSIGSRGAPDESVSVIWDAVRLHQFHFGDGYLSLSARLGDEPFPDAAVQRIRKWLVDPTELQLEVANAANLIPWADGDRLAYRDLAVHLLSPPELYEPDLPEREHWAFDWGDGSEQIQQAAKIRFPSAQVAGLFQHHRAEATEPQPSTAESTDRRGDSDLAPCPSDDPLSVVARSEDAAQPEATYFTFLLALFRHLKVEHVADLLATALGSERLASARYLSYLNDHLSLARDRFLGPSPLRGVSGGLWKRLEQQWHTGDLIRDLSPIVDGYRTNYFRDRSLRLVAKVTSTFWFLFRWILLPIILVKVTVVVGPAMVIGGAGLLVLSLFATVGVLGARWLSRRMDEGESRRALRWDWTAIIAIAELFLIAALLTWAPRLRDHVLIILGLMVTTLVLVAGSAALILRHRWRRETFARFFRQETVPVVTALLAIVSVLGLLVMVGYLIYDRGLRAFTLPNLFGGE